MGRRAAGEGSIYKLKNGKFAAMLTVGYADGKQQRKKFEGKTRRAVAEKLAIARRQIAAGVNLTSKAQPLRVFLKRWLEDTVMPTARPRSITTYAQVIQDYINPSLGDIVVQKLTVQQIQQLLTDLLRRDFAAATVRLTRTVLRQAMQQAVDWRLIDHNPADRVTVPKATKRVVDVLTPEQARALLEAARGDRLECALRLALSLGMRRGEVCGLCWSDVDLERGVLHVRGNVQYVPGNGLVYGQPKTDSSERTIKLPATLIAALRWHKERQRAERAAMGDGWQENDYVFVAANNGGMLNPCVLVEAFKRALKVAGLPLTVRFHDLRHGCASFLIAQNVHPKVISAILGHSSIQITMNLYGHLLPGTLDDAASKVDDLLYSDADSNTLSNTGTN